MTIAIASMADFVTRTLAKEYIIPETLEHCRRADELMPDRLYAALQHVYLQAVGPGSGRKAMSFGNPFDELDDRKPTILTAVAGLVVQHGIRLSTGKLLDPERDASAIKTKISSLEWDLSQIFRPNFKLHDPLAEVDIEGERLAQFLKQNQAAIPMNDKLQTVLDSAVGPRRKQSLPLSPIFTHGKPDLSLRQYVNACLEKAVGATVDLCDSLARSQIEVMSPEQRDNMQAYLARRAEDVKADPNFRPEISDGTAAKLSAMLKAVSQRSTLASRPE